VSDTFPRAGRLVKGYDVEQVEAFLSRARAAYEDSGRGPAMTSWHVRTVGFDLVRGGYDVEAVDAALDRIEDAFVSGRALAPDSVRLAVFKSRRGGRGYREASVDAFLDRVVELLVVAAV